MDGPFKWNLSEDCEQLYPGGCNVCTGMRLRNLRLSCRSPAAAAAMSISPPCSPARHHLLQASCVTWVKHSCREEQQRLQSD